LRQARHEAWCSQAVAAMHHEGNIGSIKQGIAIIRVTAQRFPEY
jgi:hypothetical protein